MRHALLLAVLLAACDSKPAATPPPAPSPVPSPAGKGTLRVTVRVQGDDIGPILRKARGAEEHCGSEPIDIGTWRVHAGSKGLQDAYLYIEDAAGAFATGPIPSLDNRGCRFLPAVILMAPGDLKLINSDTLPHSSDFRSQLNPPENHLLAVGASKIVALRIPEIIPVTCSVHPWMAATVIVAKTPLGGLTDAAGKLEIRGVPAGRRRLVLWHRCVGEIAAEVEIPADGVLDHAIDVRPLVGFRTR